MESCPIEIEQDISVDQQELKELFDKACSQTFSTEKKYYGNCCETTLKFRFLVINGPNDEKECAIHIYMEIHLDYDEMELDEKYYGKIAFYNKSSKFVFHSNKDSIFKSGENWYSDEKCEMTDILNPEKKFFDNGKFTLQMKGLLFRDKSEEKQIFQTTLGQHLWERDDRDFVISVGKNGEDKTEIKIHKLVFASRSPVFDAMLKAEMKEKVESRLEIVDFGVEIIEAAVDFFYDQESYVMLNLDNLISLLQFADKYDIEDLKFKIGYRLSIQIHPASICQISNASFISNCQILKNVCIQTMLFYINQKIPFNNAETLDKDFAVEMIHKASLQDEKSSDA